MHRLCFLPAYATTSINARPACGMPLWIVCAFCRAASERSLVQASPDQGLDAAVLQDVHDVVAQRLCLHGCAGGLIGDRTGEQVDGCGIAILEERANVLAGDDRQAEVDGVAEEDAAE